MPPDLRGMELHLRSIHEISRPYVIGIINDIIMSKVEDTDLISIQKALGSRLHPVLKYEPMMVDSDVYKLLLNILDGDGLYARERPYILKIVYDWVNNSKTRYYSKYVTPVVKLLMDNKPPRNPEEQLTDKTIFIVGE